MTPTKDLVRALRRLPSADALDQAADRLISQEKRIQELESLAETDYLHIAMEAQKRIAELESANTSLKNKVRELEDEIAELAAGEDL